MEIYRLKSEFSGEELGERVGQIKNILPLNAIVMLTPLVLRMKSIKKSWIKLKISSI